MFRRRWDGVQVGSSPEPSIARALAWEGVPLPGWGPSVASGGGAGEIGPQRSGCWRPRASLAPPLVPPLRLGSCRTPGQRGYRPERGQRGRGPGTQASPPPELAQGRGLGEPTRQPQGARPAGTDPALPRCPRRSAVPRCWTLPGQVGRLRGPEPPARCDHLPAHHGDRQLCASSTRQPLATHWQQGSGPAWGAGHMSTTLPATEVAPLCPPSQTWAARTPRHSWQTARGNGGRAVGTLFPVGTPVG